MLTVNVSTIISVIGLAISFAGFLLVLAKWALSRIDKAIDSIKSEMVISVSDVKQELLTLRTNDLHHIYQEIRDIRKDKQSA